MSTGILAAIRQHPQLKGSLKLTAQEIAHRASSSGFVRVSYGYLASKTRLTIRTMIAHVHRLEALGILRKQRVWISANRCAVNLYTLLVRPLHRCASEKAASKLPQPEKEKETSVREDLEKQQRGLRFWTPGSEQWQKTCEEITRLEGLLRC
jgi:hypothetical protein